ncbi:hypothetical protein L596_021931 [Steinernema carpocapsae]|uniref:Ig-like domain-containing protein n=1 Tax=Steinernema carpocapsae TaxID=34508 RepID=A0A4U5MK92_STECR|nr:hypothetical protein L596_021931 [Steinernema carpocapsae]
MTLQEVVSKKITPRKARLQVPGERGQANVEATITRSKSPLGSHYLNVDLDVQAGEELGNTEAVVNLSSFDFEELDLFFGDDFTDEEYEYIPVMDEMDVVVSIHEDYFDEEELEAILPAFAPTLSTDALIMVSSKDSAISKLFDELKPLDSPLPPIETTLPVLALEKARLSIKAEKKRKARKEKEPKEEEPEVEEEKKDEPVLEEPKVDEPIPEEPKKVKKDKKKKEPNVEEVIDEPTVEEVKPEEPKAEEPKPEEPRKIKKAKMKEELKQAEEPKPEEPTPEESKKIKKPKKKEEPGKPLEEGKPEEAKEAKKGGRPKPAKENVSKDVLPQEDVTVQCQLGKEKDNKVVKGSLIWTDRENNVSADVKPVEKTKKTQGIEAEAKAEDPKLGISKVKPDQKKATTSKKITPASQTQESKECNPKKYKTIQKSSNIDTSTNSSYTQGSQAGPSEAIDHVMTSTTKVMRSSSMVTKNVDFGKPKTRSQANTQRFVKDSQVVSEFKSLRSLKGSNFSAEVEIVKKAQSAEATTDVTDQPKTAVAKDVLKPGTESVSAAAEFSKKGQSEIAQGEVTSKSSETLEGLVKEPTKKDATLSVELSKSKDLQEAAKTLPLKDKQKKAKKIGQENTQDATVAVSLNKGTLQDAGEVTTTQASKDRDKLATTSKNAKLQHKGQKGKVATAVPETVEDKSKESLNVKASKKGDISVLMDLSKASGSQATTEKTFDLKDQFEKAKKIDQLKTEDVSAVISLKKSASTDQTEVTHGLRLDSRDELATTSEKIVSQRADETFEASTFVSTPDRETTALATERTTVSCLIPGQADSASTVVQEAKTDKGSLKTDQPEHADTTISVRLSKSSEETSTSQTLPVKDQQGKIRKIAPQKDEASTVDISLNKACLDEKTEFVSGQSIQDQTLLLTSSRNVLLRKERSASDTSQVLSEPQTAQIFLESREITFTRRGSSSTQSTSAQVQDSTTEKISMKTQKPGNEESTLSIVLAKGKVSQDATHSLPTKDQQKKTKKIGQTLSEAASVAVPLDTPGSTDPITFSMTDASKEQDALSAVAKNLAMRKSPHMHQLQEKPKPPWRHLRRLYPVIVKPKLSQCLLEFWKKETSSKAVFERSGQKMSASERSADKNKLKKAAQIQEPREITQHAVMELSREDVEDSVAAYGTSQEMDKIEESLKEPSKFSVSQDVQLQKKEETMQADRTQVPKAKLKASQKNHPDAVNVQATVDLSRPEPEATMINKQTDSQKDPQMSLQASGPTSQEASAVVKLSKTDQSDQFKTFFAENAQDSTSAHVAKLESENIKNSVDLSQSQNAFKAEAVLRAPAEDVVKAEINFQSAKSSTNVAIQKASQAILTDHRLHAQRKTESVAARVQKPTTVKVSADMDLSKIEAVDEITISQRSIKRGEAEKTVKIQKPSKANEDPNLAKMDQSEQCAASIPGGLTTQAGLRDQQPSEELTSVSADLTAFLKNLSSKTIAEHITSVQPTQDSSQGSSLALKSSQAHLTQQDQAGTTSETLIEHSLQVDKDSLSTTSKMLGYHKTQQDQGVQFFVKVSLSTKSTVCEPTETSATSSYDFFKNRTEFEDQTEETLESGQSSGAKFSVAEPPQKRKELKHVVPGPKEPTINEFKPSFLSKRKIITVNDGERTIIKVKVMSNPEPRMSIYLNNKYMEETDDVQIVAEQDNYLYTMFLILSKVEKEEHEGVFSFVATNQLGHDKCTVTLNVSKEPTELTKSPKPVPTLPKITQKSAVVNSNEGEPVDLTFSASGNPPPSFAITKDGQKLDANYTMTVNQFKENTVVTVKFDKVRLSDCGDYTCEARNQAGSVSCRTRLNVRSEKKKVTSRPPSPKPKVASREASPRVVISRDVSPEVKEESPIPDGKKKKKIPKALFIPDEISSKFGDPSTLVSETNLMAQITAGEEAEETISPAKPMSASVTKRVDSAKKVKEAITAGEFPFDEVKPALTAEEAAMLPPLPPKKKEDVISKPEEQELAEVTFATEVAEKVEEEKVEAKIGVKKRRPSVKKDEAKPEEPEAADVTLELPKVKADAEVEAKVEVKKRRPSVKKDDKKSTEVVPEVTSEIKEAVTLPEEKPKEKKLKKKDIEKKEPEVMEPEKPKEAELVLEAKPEEPAADVTCDLSKLKAEAEEKLPEVKKPEQIPEEKPKEKMLKKKKVEEKKPEKPKEIEKAPEPKPLEPEATDVTFDLPKVAAEEVIEVKVEIPEPKPDETPEEKPKEKKLKKKKVEEKEPEVAVPEKPLDADKTPEEKPTEHKPEPTEAPEEKPKKLKKKKVEEKQPEIAQAVEISEELVEELAPEVPKKEITQETIEEEPYRRALKEREKREGIATPPPAEIFAACMATRLPSTVSSTTKTTKSPGPSTETAFRFACHRQG